MHKPDPHRYLPQDFKLIEEAILNLESDIP